MKQRKFELGDVVRRYDTDEGRVIFLITDDCYYFCDYDFASGSFFYNPTKAAFGFTVMEQKFEKVGKIDDLEKFCMSLSEISLHHGTAFALSAELKDKHKVII